MLAALAVRVLANQAYGPVRFSTEFCGGTHVPSTGQVGPLVLISEGSVGSNIRRVEALTGSNGYEFLADLRTQLADVSGVLKTQPARVVDAAMSVTDRQRLARPTFTAC